MDWGVEDRIDERLGIFIGSVCERVTTKDTLAYVITMMNLCGILIS